MLHELPRKVIEYRELAKLKSTYVDALPKLIEPATGRLHTRLSQTGAATGRLSSSDPNLQNIPVRTELGRQIRAAFVADPGWTLLSADYSQIELRILAHFSEDPVLVEAFRTGQDIHSRTAQEVFGVGPMAQTPEHRRAAKVINFGIIYGLSPFGLAQQSRHRAARSRQVHRRLLRALSRRKKISRSLARGSPPQPASRARSSAAAAPSPKSSRPQVNLRNLAERTALNTPLQGTAADLIKLAMIQIQRELDRAILPRPHDPASPRRTALRSAARGTRPPPRPRSPRHGAGPQTARPLVVEMKAGPNWRDMNASKRHAPASAVSF